MWVDGKELLVKGGGLTSTKGTIYGAPDTPLTKGTHVAVAYAQGRARDGRRVVVPRRVNRRAGAVGSVSMNGYR